MQFTYLKHMVYDKGEEDMKDLTNRIIVSNRSSQNMCLGISPCLKRCYLCKKMAVHLPGLGIKGNLTYINYYLLIPYYL